ncbi:hypothetical protein COOONC_06271 [Cooperia oncophora]
MHSADEVRIWTRNSFMDERATQFRGLRGSLTGDHIPYIFFVIRWPLAIVKKKLYSGFSAEDRGISQRPVKASVYAEIVPLWVTRFIRQHGPSLINQIAKRILKSEHHLLPDHFRKDSFFVKPPSATPPPPHDNSAVATSQYSTMLSVTCDKNKRSKKKLQLQYQTYASNQASVPDQYNNPNSPLSLMPPPPPPITLSSSAMHAVPVNDDMFERPIFAPAPLGGSGTAESVVTNEPLLSASHKTVRAGVSPSCPRHGRAVLSLHPSRGSLASAGNAPTLEEIQV